MREERKLFKHEIIRNRVFDSFLSMNENHLIEKIAKDPLVTVHPFIIIKAWILLGLIKEMSFKECTEPNKHFGEVLKHYERT